MAYVLPTQKIDPSEVGDTYHLAIGSTTPGQASPDRIYGYLLAEGTKFEEHTDLNAKSELTQYSSPNLIDRDLVNTPRVTDGDFSGGMAQLNWLDTTRYWDSDLDIRTPGFLQIGAGWAATGGLGGFAGANDQVISQGVSNIANFGIQPVNDQGVTLPGFGANVIAIDTDGDVVYGSDGTNIKWYAGAGAWTALGGGACTAHDQIWFVDEGTGGRFIYYRITNGRGLMKLDIPGGTRDIAVPLGGSVDVAHGSGRAIVDLCPYLGGVAILTNDEAGSGFDVWSHDNSTLSRIVRMKGFTAAGICNNSGSLFVTAYTSNQWDPPILLRIDSGTYSIVARGGLPFLQQTACQFGAPVAGENFIFFMVHNPFFTNITQTDYVASYDILSGALAHYPAPTGFTVSSNPIGVRSLAIQGRAAAIPIRALGVGHLYYQTNSGFFPSSTPSHNDQGWLVSSRMDFQTPGISKLMRRIIVHHLPLRTSEAITVNAYVDVDPSVVFPKISSPVPTATVTNAVVGSDTTILTLPAHTVGMCMVFALGLAAGVSSSTSPVVYYVSMEVAVPWTWQFTADCSSRRRALNGQEDPQGLRAKDLVMFIHFAWENAQALTFYHPNGETYSAMIEEAVFESLSPVNRITPDGAADLEGLWHLTLRDVPAAAPA